MTSSVPKSWNHWKAKISREHFRLTGRKTPFREMSSSEKRTAYKSLMKNPVYKARRLAEIRQK